MATLDDIVSAAAKVFRTKGYHAATVRDIADEVGILKGSLYHHFDSKEDLLYLVVKEPIAQMYRTISEIAAADGTATEKLRRAISAHLEAFDRHYPHLFVYLRERESVKRRFREMIGFSPKEYERCWQQIIREGVETGEFRAELDIQVASYGLLGMLNWLYKWYDPQGRLSVQEVAEQFTSLALAGLAAAPAAPHRNRTKPSTLTHIPLAPLAGGEGRGEGNPCLVFQRCPDRVRVAFDHAQIGSRNIFGLAAPLFPILQCTQIEHELFRELGLSKAQAITQRSQRFWPKAASQFLIGQRLRIRIVEGCLLDFLIGHPGQPIPIRAAFGFGIVPRPVAYKLLFHDGSPSWR